MPARTVFVPAWPRRPGASCSSAVARKAALASRPASVLVVTASWLPTVVPVSSDRRDRPDPGFAFRKPQRLSNARDYSRVFEKARRSRDKCFTVLARPRGPRHSSEPGRLGLAISKKHCRKASARNRIKRLARESFRLHQSRLRGLDLVVLNQPAAALSSNRELLLSLELHWQRLSGPRHGKRKTAMDTQGG